MQWGYLSPQAINKGFDIQILFAVLVSVNSGKILKLLASSSQPPYIVPALLHQAYGYISYRVTLTQKNLLLSQLPAICSDLNTFLPILLPPFT